MWTKGSELANLKALRRAARRRPPGGPIVAAPVTLRLRVYADPRAGDLDNFITGVRDGLMAARAAPTPATWAKLPELIRPNRAVGVPQW